MKLTTHLQHIFNTLKITAIILMFASCSRVTPILVSPELGLKDQVVSGVQIEPIESKFEIVRELSYFKEVVRVSDCVINLKEFQDEISKIEKFGNTQDSGEKVLVKMLSPIKAKLRYYRSRPFSSVTAYTVGDEIYFNTRNNPRSLEKMVNTLLHEKNHTLGYKHISKYNIGRDVDSSYLIGNVAEKYVRFCK